MSDRNERDFDEQQYAQRHRQESQGYEQQMRERESRDRDMQGGLSSRNYTPGYGPQQMGPGAGHGQQSRSSFGERAYEPEAHGYSESYLSQGYGAQGSAGAQGFGPEGHGMHGGYGRPGWGGQADEGSYQSTEVGSQGYGQRQEQPGYGYQGSGQLGVSRQFGPQRQYGPQGSLGARRYPYGEPPERSQLGGRQPTAQQWDSAQQWHAPNEERHGEQAVAQHYGQQYGQQLYGQQGLGQQYGQQGYTPGMRSSHRGLGPKNYSRPDERIREDINERLTDADDIDARGLMVEVSNGVATLTGTVEQRWMKHRAEDIAEACSGVRDVHNQIRVQQQDSAGTTLGSRTLSSGLGAGGGSGSASTSTGSGTSTSTSAGSGSSSTSTRSGSTPTGH
ncbi:BON domain-containing protein [Cognatiluteimonas profundi]|uniref:BON domain-containing protein n=1 Tax=Cognatiluteimonas profundi TaxID=2594501 RepID=UPI00131C7ACA|nr:BON domain-containing protein [Lysobacter profundi]